MGKIKIIKESKLLNGSGEDSKIYPVTLAKAVYTDAHTTVQEFIDSLPDFSSLDATFDPVDGTSDYSGATTVTVGGIKKGTKTSDLKGLTISQVLSKILYAVTYPVFGSARTVELFLGDKKGTFNVNAGGYIPASSNFTLKCTPQTITPVTGFPTSYTGLFYNQQWHGDMGVKVKLGQTYEVYCTVDIKQGTYLPHNSQGQPIDEKGNQYTYAPAETNVESNHIKFIGMAKLMVWAGTDTIPDDTADNVILVHNDSSIDDMQSLVPDHSSIKSAAGTADVVDITKLKNMGIDTSAIQLYVIAPKEWTIKNLASVDHALYVPYSLDVEVYKEITYNNSSYVMYKASETRELDNCQLLVNYKQ